MTIALASKSPEYQRVHYQVVKLRGQASGWCCSDCSNQAKDWSWIHNQNPYDPDSYTPRCRRCHLLYDMTADWRKKMGNPIMPGESHWNARLTESDVANIRDMWQSGNWKQIDLADIFGVSKSHISNIISGRKFK